MRSIKWNHQIECRFMETNQELEMKSGKLMRLKDQHENYQQ